MEDGGKLTETGRVPYSACLAAPGRCIPLRWSSPLAELAGIIAACSVPLRDSGLGFAPMIALQAYARNKGDPPQSEADVKNHVYHADSRKGESYIPYLNGGDVERFKVHWSGSYLSWGRWLAEPQQRERFSGPRILIREIIRPAPYAIVAAFVEEDFLYNKSVLHIIAENTGARRAIDMKALCALLGSKLASFLIMTRGRKSQRKLFPKVVNADLKDFPISRDFARAAEELASMHDDLRAAVAANESGRIAQRQNELDARVYALYGLKQAEAGHVEKFLSAGW
jgi:hypothetical protein